MFRRTANHEAAALQTVSAGHTLVELLASLSIASIVVALALPDWSGWLAERRVLVAAERLRGELTAARRLALAGGQVVRLCPTIDRMACETQRDWSAGWLSQKQSASGWQTLQVASSLPSRVRIETNTSNLSAGLQFNERGFAILASGGLPAAAGWCAPLALKAARSRLPRAAVCEAVSAGLVREVTRIAARDWTELP